VNIHDSVVSQDGTLKGGWARLLISLASQHRGCPSIREKALSRQKYPVAGGRLLPRVSIARVAKRQQRRKWGCATSRAFREVACRTADTGAGQEIGCFGGTRSAPLALA